MMLGSIGRLFILSFCFTLFSGCISAPLQSTKQTGVANQTNYEKFTEGISTKQDIRALLGEPNGISEGGWGAGIVQWTYRGYPNLLQFSFNQRGILTDKILRSYSYGHVATIRSNKCIAGLESGGVICGQPAYIWDFQRGGMVCEKHAPGKQVVTPPAQSKVKTSPIEQKKHYSAILHPTPPSIQQKVPSIDNNRSRKQPYEEAEQQGLVEQSDGRFLLK
jgi:hypothetical protein